MENILEVRLMKEVQLKLRVFKMNKSLQIQDWYAKNVDLVCQLL